MIFAKYYLYESIRKGVRGSVLYLFHFYRMITYSIDLISADILWKGLQIFRDKEITTSYIKIFIATCMSSSQSNSVKIWKFYLARHEVFYVVNVWELSLLLLNQLKV